MIVEINDDSTSIVVEAPAHNYVRSYSVAFGRKPLQSLIQSHVRDKHNLLIGGRTPEAIRREIGTAAPPGGALRLEVRARDATRGTPARAVLTGEEVHEALAGRIGLFVEAVRAALAQTPAILLDEIKVRGLTLRGEALRDLDRRLSADTNFPVSPPG